MSNVATHVIRKLGGPQITATAAGVDISRVHRWTYPKERGGTGGLIPSRHHASLLEFARSNNIDLGPADFFDNGTEQPSPQHTSGEAA